MPANLYVATSFGGSGSNLIWNSGRYDQVSGLTLGTNAFNDVSSALSAYSSGDTIHVGVGTYSLPAQTIIGKSVSLIGSQNSQTDSTPDTTLEPSSSVTVATGTGSGWIVVNNSANVNFSTFVIDGLVGTYNESEMLRYEVTGTSKINNVDFENIGGTISGSPYGPYTGVAMADLSGVVNVTGGTYTNIGREGLVYSGSTASGTVINITYTGKGAGDQLDYAVEVNTGASATVTASYLEDCLGTASTDQSQSSALLVSDAGSVLNAYGNLIENNENGIVAGYVDSDTCILSAEYNNILNNTTGVYTSLASAADLTNNYWGVFTGPVAGTGINQVDDTDTASNISTFLHTWTWVWNGTSPANYLSNTSFFAVVNNTGNSSTAATLHVYDGTGATSNVLGLNVNQGISTGSGGSSGILGYFPFGSSYLGGLTVAIGSVTGNYRPDIIVGVAAGDATTNSHVKVYDLYDAVLLIQEGVSANGGLDGTNAELASFYAFAVGFHGGVSVSAADVNGTGVEDIVVTRGPLDNGAGHSYIAQNAGDPAPGTVVHGTTVSYSAPGADMILYQYNGASSPTEAASIAQGGIFPGFPGGIHVGAGDFAGNGTEGVVVGPATYIAAKNRLDHVETYSFSSSGGGSASGGVSSGTLSLTNSYYAFKGTPPNGMGIYVDGVDLEGSGTAVVVVTTDYDPTNTAGGAHTLTLNANGTTSGSNGAGLSFFAYATNFYGGASVSSARVAGTANDQILVGAGPGNTTGSGAVRDYSSTGALVVTDFEVFGTGFLGGVQVGG